MISQSIRKLVRFCKETAWGEVPTPAPAMTEIMVVESTMSANKTTEESATKRPDRQVQDVAMVGLDGKGQIKFEPTPSSKELIAAAMHGTPVSVAIGNGGTALVGTITLAATGQTVTFSSATDYNRIKGAGIILIAGSATAGNNGRKRVVSRNDTTNVLTLATGSIAANDDSGTTAAIAMSAWYVRGGTTDESYLLEDHYQDSDKFQNGRGVVFTKLSLDIVTRKYVIVTIDFICKAVAKAQAALAGSTVSAADELPAKAPQNVSLVAVDGTAIDALMSQFKLAVTFAGRLRPVLTSLYSAGIGIGKQVVDGSFSLLFEDTVHAAKFEAHDKVALLAYGTFDSGAHWAWSVPAASYSKDDLGDGGAEADVMEELDFKCQRGGTDGYTVQYDQI